MWFVIPLGLQIVDNMPQQRPHQPVDFITVWNLQIAINEGGATFISALMA